MSTLNVSAAALRAHMGAGAGAGGLPDDLPQLGMASGSVLLWGYIAEHASTPKALASAGAGLLLSKMPFALRLHVLRGELPDFSPHRYALPAPPLASEREDSDGPVRVSIDYHIDPKDYAAFTKAIHQLRDVRLRDGAIRWGVYQDAADPGHLNETFVTESWLEYLRQRERFTASDLATRERVFSFHRAQ